MITLYFNFLLLDSSKVNVVLIPSGRVMGISGLGFFFFFLDKVDKDGSLLFVVEFLSPILFLCNI